MASPEQRALEYHAAGGKWATIVSVAAVLFSAMVAWLYFASAVAAQTAETASPEVAYVTAISLNVRAGPGAEHPVVAQLARGSRVDILEHGEGWARVAGGWVASAYLSAAEPAAPTLSDVRIRSMIVEQSLRSYHGSCPCPYNVDRSGRRCGGRSAYSRPGGASPLCYPTDVSDARVGAFRRRME